MSNENEDLDADDLAAALDEKPAAKSKATAKKADVEKVEAESLSESDNPKKGDLNLDVVLDIPVTIAMEIGRTKLMLKFIRAADPLQTLVQEVANTKYAKTIVQ